MYDVIVEVGTLGQSLEVTVSVDNVSSEEEAKVEAEEWVRDNMYIVATEAEKEEE
jgi:hypothetical protein